MNKKIFFTSVFIALLSLNIFAQREVFSMNPGWNYNLGDISDAEKFSLDDSSWDLVSVPHTLGVVSADLKEFDKYSRNIGWYRKTFTVPEDWMGKRVFLEFQGAMQVTDLYVNEQFVGQYAVSGYDSFSFDITDFIKVGSNLIAIKINNKENKNIPPDGVPRDFALFGGLYRDVNLVVTGDVRVPFPWEKFDAGVRVTFPDISEESATVKVETAVSNESSIDKEIQLETVIELKEGGEVGKISTTQEIKAGETFTFNQNFIIEDPELWSPDSPNLYIVSSEVIDGKDTSDTVSTQIGLRWVEWDPTKGFFLNGKSFKLIGTNRHQNWPYIGGAVSNENHYAEAQQLKDMGLNWIRLSHYPHDPEFITALDEIGLMALEEGPTWWKRGPATWMDNLEKSWTSMIRRDRNHPSIIIWNACVNHSLDAEPRLLESGRREDPTRAYGQADVKCPMDFRHGRISGDNALTLEHTGHTYPTSRGEYRREIEQAKRHMEMYKKSKETPGNHGTASWCGYDYNSFYNSKANAARHGIFDLFRLPKLSKWWHTSELTDEPMAHIVKDGRKVIVYSNCDQIKLLGGRSKNSVKEIAVQNKRKDGLLANPPYYFTVNRNIKFLEVEGFKDGEKVVEEKWSEPTRPVALRLTSSRDEIVADGADIAIIEVEVIDENGMVVSDSDTTVFFAIKEGYGQLIGENPIKLIAGKHIILLQSGYEDKDIEVVATSYGLESDEIEIDVEDLEDDVIFPENFTAKEPSKLGYTVKNTPNRLIGRESREEVAPFSFNTVTDAEPGQWVESDAVLVDGITKQVDISIKGGEYRVYVTPYTDKRGKVGGGDAVFVRVQASEVSGERRVVTVKIGDKVAEFVVVTK